MFPTENSQETLTPTETWQIGCSAFCRIVDAQGRFMLTINAKKHSKGQVVLSPPGGKIRINEAGRADVEGIPGFIPDSWKKGNIVFKFANTQCLPLFARWFLAGKNRETSTSVREFCEELCDETHVLSLKNAAQICCALAGYYLQIGKPNEDDERQPGIQKIRFIEVWDGQLPNNVMQQLVHQTIYFATAEEIVAGITRTGITIGAVSQSLLYPTTAENIIKSAGHICI